MRYPRIHLKPGKEESLLRLHPWVFSGAISRSEGEPEEGELVDVIDSSGRFIARGHCQIGSIAVRVLTFEEREIDQTWWDTMISRAHELRITLGLAGSDTTDAYRLIHGEGDGLPGLIVDIYGDTAVIQCHSVGMYMSRDLILSAIRTVLGGVINNIYDKSSTTVPFNAGLDAVDGYILKQSQGTKVDANALPESVQEGSEKGSGSGRDYVLENGLKFFVDWERGQKTGFFLDQRDNRELLKRFCNGKSVLNTFCYTGGFSVYALAGGAAKVVSVDSSELALSVTDKNIGLNFPSTARHTTVNADATRYIREVDDQYDVIVLDPPAFAKHRGAVKNALQGYKRLNMNAIRAIRPGGMLFTFSCSQAIDFQAFRTIVFSAAAATGRNVRILHRLFQPADHPVNIYHPEGEYLKGLVLYVE